MSNHQSSRRRGDSDDIDSEEELQFGIRRSRRRTNFVHRGSSSLYPAEIMDRDAYYSSAEQLMEESHHLARMIALLVAAWARLRSVLVIWQSVTGISSDVIDSIFDRVRQLRKLIESILLLMRWLVSYGEMALLYAEDLAVFVRRRHRFQPRRLYTLDSLSRSDCDSFFGLRPDALRQLFIHWRVPTEFRTQHREVFQGEEAFIIFLFHLVKGRPYTEMARHTFGGDPRRFSTMFNLMVDHLYFTFYNKISGTSMDQWVPRYLERCRMLIYTALGNSALYEREYVDGELVDESWIYHYWDYATFRPFGFLDDVALPSARPGSRISRIRDLAHDIQRAFYSGYLRLHGMKAQVVYLPIGIIGSVFITELRQNDNGVQNLSGLNDYLIEILSGFLVGGLFPCVYCDGIFAVLATILPRFTNPTEGEHLLNVKLASLRECIEHVFADHHNRFQLFDCPQLIRIFHSGVRIRRMFLVSFFILNCYYCITGQRARYFGQVPPTLEDYIPLEEILQPPPAVNLGRVWDYGIQLN